MPVRFDTFICYATPDRGVADCICDTFEHRGIRCWVAPRNIMKGVTWAEAIIEAIKASRTMVVIVSGHADKSLHVIREVTLADNLSKPLMFFCITDVKPTGGLAYYISVSQYRDALTSPLQPHVEGLAEDVALLIRRDGQGTPAPEAPSQAARIDEPHPVPPVPAPHPALRNEITPADFLDFIGLRYGDRIERAVQVFGPPAAGGGDTPYKFQEYQYVTTPDTGPALELRWWTTSRKVMRIDVRSPQAVEFVRQRSPDEKLSFLGRGREEIVHALGPPTQARPGALEYAFSRNFASGLLEFVCPPGGSRPCREINVHWFKP